MTSPVYNVLLILGFIVALLFILLVFFTSKGDAMSGGGQIRTTFKGRATIDDKISRMTLMFAGAFIVIMIVLDVLSTRVSSITTIGPR